MAVNMLFFCFEVRYFNFGDYLLLEPASIRGTADFGTFVLSSFSSSLGCSLSSSHMRLKDRIWFNIFFSLWKSRLSRGWCSEQMEARQKKKMQWTHSMAVYAKWDHCKHTALKYHMNINLQMSKCLYWRCESVHFTRAYAKEVLADNALCSRFLLLLPCSASTSLRSFSNAIISNRTIQPSLLIGRYTVGSHSLLSTQSFCLRR